MAVYIKRVYEPIVASDGNCFLVDRIWPRGIKKEELVITAWLKDIAPSTELRKWFGHQPQRFPEFEQKYLAELTADPTKEEILKGLCERAKTHNITLLYAAKDQLHNQAVVLRAELLRRMEED